MAKINLTYKAIGIIEGYIWQPTNDKCQKEFDIVFSKNDKPFTTKFESLEDIKNIICNDGDFKSCEILEGELIIDGYYDNKRIRRVLSLV